MCKSQTTFDRPKANVVNEVKITEEHPNLGTIEIYLLIITIVIVINFLIRMYQMHKKNIKKQYLSKANESNTI